MRLILLSIAIILIVLLMSCYSNKEETKVMREGFDYVPEKYVYDYQNPLFRYKPPCLQECNTNVIHQEFAQYYANDENKFKNPVEKEDEKTEKDIKPWDFQPSVKYNFLQGNNPYDTLTVQKKTNVPYWNMYTVYPRTAFDIPT